MMKSRYILWIGSGILIGAAAGIITGSRLEKSGAMNRILSEAEKLESDFTEKSRSAKKAFAYGAGELSRIIRKNLSNPVPDLYKATESLTMNEGSGVYEW